MSNILKDSEGNVFEYPQRFQIPTEYTKPYVSFNKDNPLKKSKLITTLKIQMGLSCNYSCDYCSQKFVERAETYKKDIDEFMRKLEVLEFDEQQGLKIEFWGGDHLYTGKL
jgi:uncharacterized protein